MIYLLQDQLSVLSSATSQHVGVFADMTTSCEILRVFLLLLLQVHFLLVSASVVHMLFHVSVGYSSSG